jgi:hypothetical protein
MSVPRRRKGREPLNQIAGTPATVPTATEDIPNQVEWLAGDPTHDDIARRAYELFEERGGEPIASGRTGSRRNASCGQLAVMARRRMAAAPPAATTRTTRRGAVAAVWIPLNEAHFEWLLPLSSGRVWQGTTTRAGPDGSRSSRVHP